MADGILGLGTGQATTLNSELIEKLKTNWTKIYCWTMKQNYKNYDWKETFSSIETKVSALLDAIKPLIYLFLEELQHLNKKCYNIWRLCYFWCCWYKSF